MASPQRIAFALSVGAGTFFLFQNYMPKAVSHVMSPPAPAVIITDPKVIKPLKNVEGIIREAREATEADAKGWQARIAKDPGDTDARARLLEASAFALGQGKHIDLHNEQVVWFAANQPESPVFKHGWINVDNIGNARTYALMTELFDKALAKKPNSVPLLTNYARFTKVSDNDLSIELQERAVALEPKNGQLVQDLGFTYWLKSRGMFGRDAAMARKALQCYAKARKLGYRENSAYLIEAAFASGDIAMAEKEAKETLAKSKDPDEIHTARTTLGEIALQAGNVEEAKKQLIASAEVEGSPVLGSFGPQMSLAQALMDKGETVTVVKLELCGKFWEDERQVRWLKQAKAGEMPDFS